MPGKELSFARAVFNDFIEALEDRRQPPIANPVRSRVFLSEAAPRTRYLSDDEEEKLRQEMPASEWPKVLVALLTGLDRGVQLSLRWTQIDMQARTIAAERHKGRRSGAVPVTVAINDELLAVLRALPSRLTSEWVFPNEKGTAPVNGEAFDRLVFRPALKRAGIKGFRWKDLRHTFATRLRMDGGADLKSIAELLGHTSTRMTERYAHATPGHLHALVQRISRVPAETPTGTSTGTGTLRSVGRRTQRREETECPRRDSNPRYRRERPTS